jgi:hypothetical protein
LAWARIASWSAFVLPFVGLLTWFRVVDVFHLHFFEVPSTWTYLAYNGLRALYALYLAWLLYWVGSILLRTLKNKGTCLDLGLLGEVVLCFYAGAAIANAVGFFLGCLQHYYYWILAPATVLPLGASYGSFQTFLARAGAGWQFISAAGKDRLRAGAILLTLGAVIFVAVLLLVMKGLPPGGGHDYYTHYFPYLKRVVASHGLLPNDLWYHYYVSKGATLVFWSVILTDFQAPEIVTYVFVLASGLAACSIVWQWSGNALLAMAALEVYLAAFVFTPPFVFSSSDQYPIAWGQFQKHHELTGSLIASLAWLVLVMPRLAGSRLRVWSLFASLFAANAILFAPTAYPLVVLLLALGMLAWTLGKQSGVVKCLGSAVAAATSVLACLLVVNYWTTGLAEVTPFRLFWKYADQERFSQVWSPYLMLLLGEGSSPEMGSIKITLPSSMPLWEFMKALMRYDHLSNFFPWKILIPGLWLVIGLLLLLRRRPKFALAPVIVVIVGFLAASALLGGASGQHVSAIRYFSFTIFFVNLFGVLTWTTLFELLGQRALLGKLAHIVLSIFACWIALAALVRIPTNELRHCLMFALGRVSLAGSYDHNRNDTLFDPAVPATSNLPAGARVYCFNPYQCVAPTCELETFVSYALGKHWHVIMFEPPEHAQEILRQEHLDYFLVDLNGWIEDIVPYAPLFSADAIANFLQVVWNEGDVYLLTWPGPGTHPLPESFLTLYRDRLAKMTDSQQLYARLRNIYDAHKGKPYPIQRDPTLPAIKGWQ